MFKFVTSLLPLLCCQAWGIEEFHIELKDHLFYPSTIEIPAHQKVKLIVHNLDPTPEEFDSFDLNRDKVVFAGRHAVIYVGPLQPGEYGFFGEYNPNTARGVVIVLEPGSEGKNAN
jgi:plastocyanin domain-containing protein